MKEYKLIYLNKGLKLTVEKDLEQAEDVINQQVSAGWTLEQVVTPASSMGALVGVFSREKN